MHVDYGFFKDVLIVYEIGSKQNQKISTHLYQIASMLKECSQYTLNSGTLQLNKSHMFKVCLKRVLKKLCKLYMYKRNDQEQRGVVFFPELLSEKAI